MKRNTYTTEPKSNVKFIFYVKESALLRILPVDLCSSKSKHRWARGFPLQFFISILDVRRLEIKVNPKGPMTYGFFPERQMSRAAR